MPDALVLAFYLGVDLVRGADVDVGAVQDVVHVGEVVVPVLLDRVVRVAGRTVPIDASDYLYQRDQ